MLKDSNANKIFLIVLVSILAILFSMDFVWQKRGKETRDEQSYSLSASDSVKITTISNDIVLSVDEKAKEASVSIGMNDRSSLKVEKRGNELVVTVSPLAKGFLNFFGSPGSPLVVNIPKTMLDRLELQTTSGDILLMQDFTANTIKIKSISGKVDILTLDADEELSLSTISGDISGYGAASKGRLSLSSTSGNVDINTMEGKDIHVNLISGDLDGALSIAANGSLEASAVSGRLDLDLGKSENLAIVASRISGSILFNGQKQDSSPATASTGNKQTEARLSTVSGEIHLTF